MHWICSHAVGTISNEKQQQTKHEKKKKKKQTLWPFCDQINAIVMHTNSFMYSCEKKLDLNDIESGISKWYHLILSAPRIIGLDFSLWTKEQQKKTIIFFSYVPIKSIDIFMIPYMILSVWLVPWWRAIKDVSRLNAEPNLMHELPMRKIKQHTIWMRFWILLLRNR